MTYTRKFIILKKEFSSIEGNIKGHGKLEVRGIRGAVTLNIENGEVESVYKALLLSNDKDNSSFYLGKIFTDELGKGKGEYNFLQRELENQNFSLGRVSALIVMKEDNVILGGYIDKDDGSIESYVNSLSKYLDLSPEIDGYHEVEEEIIENILGENLPEDLGQIAELGEDLHEEIQDQLLELIEEAEVGEFEEFEEVEEVEQVHNLAEVEEVEDAEDVEEVHQAQELDEMEQIPEIEILEQINTQEEIEEVLEESLYEEELYQEPVKATYKESQEDHIDLDHIKRLDQKNQTTMYILSILRFFPYIDPFKFNLSGFNWWLVELDSENEYKSFLPYFSYIAGGNNKEAYKGGINCIELINKYNHYLFGLYNEGVEVKYYVYGIPGSFTKGQHPNNGERGFNTWYEGKDGGGYWILYIDPMTGKPVYPQIAMIPIDDN